VTSSIPWLRWSISNSRLIFALVKFFRGDCDRFGDEQLVCATHQSSISSLLYAVVQTYTLELTSLRPIQGWINPACIAASKSWKIALGDFQTIAKVSKSNSAPTPAAKRRVLCFFWQFLQLSSSNSTTLSVISWASIWACPTASSTVSHQMSTDFRYTAFSKIHRQRRDCPPFYVTPVGWERTVSVLWSSVSAINWLNGSNVKGVGQSPEALPCVRRSLASKPMDALDASLSR